MRPPRRAARALALPATPPAPAGVSFAENLRGAGFIAASMFGFACNDALMKLIAPDLGLFPSILIRGLMASALIAILAWRFGALARLPARADAPWLAVRAAAEVGATLCYLLALMRLPLAEVSAIAQTMPLALTLACALFLGERVGWRRWAAIGAGFAGVLLIVRPGGAAFDPAALYAVVGVALFVVRDLATRKLSAATPSLLVTLFTAGSVTLMGGVGAAAAGVWPAPSWAEVGGLAAAAGLVLTGYYFSIAGMRTGDIGFSAPFRYTVLLWATILGWLIFADVPDALSWAGMAVITGAGLYAFRRERKLARGG